MSAVTHELQRRLRDEKSIPRFEPCLPKPAKVPSLAAGAARSNGARRRYNIRINNPVTPPATSINHSVARSDNSLPSLTTLPIIISPHGSESPQSIASERLRCCSGRATSLWNRLARCTSYYLDNRLHKLSPIIPSARQAAIKPKTSVVNIGSPFATFLPPLIVELTPLHWGIDRGVCGRGFDSYVTTSLQMGGRPLS